MAQMEIVQQKRNNLQHTPSLYVRTEPHMALFDSELRFIQLRSNIDTALAKLITSTIPISF